MASPLAPPAQAAAAALRRLRKDAPTLHAQVLRGDLSPHAAMVVAGFRRKTISIPLEPVAAARRLVAAFDPEQLDHLQQLITHLRLATGDARAACPPDKENT